MKHTVTCLLSMIGVTILCARIVHHFKDDSKIPIAAREVTVMADIGYLDNVFDQFQLDNGRCPPGTNGLQDLLQRPAWATNWHGPCLKQLAKDPWNHEYLYGFPTTHTNKFHLFDLFSRGGYPGYRIMGNWELP
jgi:type II secretion system protein G